MGFYKNMTRTRWKQDDTRHARTTDTLEVISKSQDPIVEISRLMKCDPRALIESTPAIYTDCVCITTSALLLEAINRPFAEKCLLGEGIPSDIASLVGEYVSPILVTYSFARHAQIKRLLVACDEFHKKHGRVCLGMYYARHESYQLTRFLDFSSNAQNRSNFGRHMRLMETIQMLLS